MAVAVAASAVLLGILGTGVPSFLLIATALGIGLTVLLGTAVMIFTFLNSSAASDDQAGLQSKDIDQ